MEKPNPFLNKRKTTFHDHFSSNNDRIRQSLVLGNASFRDLSMERNSSRTSTVSSGRGHGNVQINRISRNGSATAKRILEELESLSSSPRRDLIETHERSNHYSEHFSAPIQSGGNPLAKRPRPNQPISTPGISSFYSTYSTPPKISLRTPLMSAVSRVYHQPTPYSHVRVANNAAAAASANSQKTLPVASSSVTPSSSNCQEEKFPFEDLVLQFSEPISSKDLLQRIHAVEEAKKILAVSQSVWICGHCLRQNDRSDSSCVSCQRRNPQQKLPSDTNNASASKAIYSSSTMTELLEPIADSPTSKMYASVSVQFPSPRASFSQYNSLLDKIVKEAQTKWTCEYCLVQNAVSAQSCAACCSAKPTTVQALPASSAPQSFSPESSTTKTSPLLEKIVKESLKKWTCDICLVQNSPDVNTCVACCTPRMPLAVATGSKEVEKSQQQLPVTTSSGLDLLQKFQETAATKWTCDTCFVMNSHTDNSCVACSTPRPGFSTSTASSSSKLSSATASSMFQFTNHSSTTSVDPPIKFTFGMCPSTSTTSSVASTVPSLFTFGQSAPGIGLTFPIAPVTSLTTASSSLSPAAVALPSISSNAIMFGAPLTSQQPTHSAMEPLSSTPSKSFAFSSNNKPEMNHLTASSIGPPAMSTTPFVFAASTPGASSSGSFPPAASTTTNVQTGFSFSLPSTLSSTVSSNTPAAPFSFSTSVTAPATPFVFGSLPYPSNSNGGTSQSGASLNPMLSLPAVDNSSATNMFNATSRPIKKVLRRKR